jgi:PAS domain S-box-containing protein
MSFGGRPALLSAFIDITDRKKMEKALHETRDYLENLINFANAPMIVWDPLFRITQFNHAFEHMTDYSAEDVLGKDLGMLFPESSKKESLEKIKHTLNGAQWEVVEIPILRKDGATRIALWNSANVYAGEGKSLIATMAQGQDITERKRAEEEITRYAEEMKVKNEDLARFNRVAVDRELRMIELKKQVNELCVRSGQPPRYEIEFEMNY